MLAFAKEISPSFLGDVIDTCRILSRFKGVSHQFVCAVCLPKARVELIQESYD